MSIDMICKVCGEEFDSRRAQCPAAASHARILGEQSRLRAKLPEPGDVYSALAGSPHQWVTQSTAGWQPIRVKCRVCWSELEIKQLAQISAAPPCTGRAVKGTP